MIISGTVDRILFKSEDDYYSVFILDTEDGFITCTGNIVGLSEHMSLELDGDLIYHKKYGEQFSFVSYKLLEEMSASGVLNYLKAGNLPYIGEKMAEEIVALFGDETMDILDNNPDRLLEIRGIGQHKLEKIKEALSEGRAARKVIMELAEYGIFGADAYKIFGKYADASKSVIENEPYRLMLDVKGFGFIKADNIAKRIGISDDDIRRVKAAILYILSMASLEGHVFLRESEFKPEIKRLLGKVPENFDLALTELVIDGLLIRKPSDDGDARVYRDVMDLIENDAAHMTAALIEKPLPVRGDLEERLTRFFEETKISYDPSQKQAIEMALKNNISIVTGGPGTGKTTIVKAIIELATDMALDVKLAAPTGRAAKRLEESSGREAYTIHRLLNLRPHEDDELDIYVEDVSADLVIVDEMSMVDMSLYSSLLSALDENTSLIMVGDADQLPSVGAGNILRDLLSMEEIQNVRLDRIHRTHETSQIALVAQAIRDGGQPIFNEKGGDVFFMEQRDDETFISELLYLVDQRLPNYYGFDPVNDIQILSPAKKGNLGVENLNLLLQKHLNSRGDKFLEYKGTRFKLGDKVMQISNNYEREIQYKTIQREAVSGVFNGDIGIITEVDTFGQTLTVLFSDDYYASYDRNELGELKLAYATTVHKSQGSEFPCIIFIAWGHNYFLNNRNLLYTGITRAKELLVVMGKMSVISSMISNVSVGKRNTSLVEKIRGVLRLNAELSSL